MSHSFDSGASTDDLLTVETDFTAELRAVRGGARKSVPDHDVVEAVTDTTRTAEEALLHGVVDIEALARLEVPDTAVDEALAAVGQHGGSGGSGGATGSAASSGGVAESAAGAPEAERAAAVSEVSEVNPATADAERPTPVILQHTDHQEDVQNRAAAREPVAVSDNSSAVLPHGGFELFGVKSQPHIRAMPEVIVNELREQLRSAAVRELGVTDAAARAFSSRVSQAALVIAFLMSQLDLALDVDAVTTRAAGLFRSKDPLLGRIAERLSAVEAGLRERGEKLVALQHTLGEVQDTSAAIEQAVAYGIADRHANFLRGSHNIHDAPITHKDAVFVRDKVRESTKRQARIEQERNGRPIR